MDCHRIAGYDRLALAVGESFRARGLRDLLEAGDGDLGIEPGLRVRRRDLLHRLRVQAARRDRRKT